MTTSRYAQLETPDFETLAYKRAVFACIGLIIFFITIYAAALGSTIHFVLARSDYQKQARNLEANIASLQVQYLASSQSITLDRGATLGLHETKKISFVNRTIESGGELSLLDTHQL